MSTPTTEFVYITLKQGVDISDSSTPASQAWKESLSTIQEQNGCQRLQYGHLLESSNVLMLLIDWDSHDAQKKFSSTPAHDSMVQKLRTLAEGIHIHHVLFTPFPPSIADTSPVTEFATFYHAEKGFKENAKRFVENTAEVMNANGGLGSVLGETIEGDVVRHVDRGKGIEGGKAVVLLIGWESKEAHMRFRETGVFKENVSLLREKCSGAEMFHVKFMAV